jgi:hypothetical protein
MLALFLQGFGFLGSGIPGILDFIATNTGYKVESVVTNLMKCQGL